MLPTNPKTYVFKTLTNNNNNSINNDETSLYLNTFTIQGMPETVFASADAMGRASPVQLFNWILVQ